MSNRLRPRGVYGRPLIVIAARVVDPLLPAEPSPRLRSEHIDQLDDMLFASYGYFAPRMRIVFLTEMQRNDNEQDVVRQVFAVDALVRVFGFDWDTLFDEVTDYLDATLWADLPGGINHPLPGQPRNRFVANGDGT